MSRSNVLSRRWRHRALPHGGVSSPSCTGGRSTSAAPATTRPTRPSGAPRASPGTAPSSPGSGVTATSTTSSARLCPWAKPALTPLSLQSPRTSSLPPPSSSPTSLTSSLRSLQLRIFPAVLRHRSLHVCPRHRHHSDRPQLLWEPENCRQLWMSSFSSSAQEDHLRDQ